MLSTCECIDMSFSYREVTAVKMGISQGTVEILAEIFQEMAYSPTMDHFQKLKEKFYSVSPPILSEHFEKNWDDIQDEWVLGEKAKTRNFLNNTNNMIESINAKLKSVIPKYSSLEEFVERFFCVLLSLRTERDHKAAESFHKIAVIVHPEGSAEARYIQLLTTYASTLVLKQINLADKVKPFIMVGEGYTVDTNEGVKIVKANCCSCCFNLSMKLPCRHIIALRKYLGMDMFLTSQCNVDGI